MSVPIIILKEGTEETKEKEARMQNINAIKAITETVKSTLGPKGMNKMLVDSVGDVTITNDGAEILKLLDISAKISCVCLPSILTLIKNVNL